MFLSSSSRSSRLGRRMSRSRTKSRNASGDRQVHCCPVAGLETLDEVPGGREGGPRSEIVDEAVVHRREVNHRD